MTCARNVQSRVQAIIAVAAFAKLLFKVNAILILLIALALGVLLIRPEARKPIARTFQASSSPHWLSIGAVIMVVQAVAAFAWLLQSLVGAMGLVFFKINTLYKILTPSS